MANFAYTEYKRMLAAGTFSWATADIRAILVMTNTTADTEEDVNTISAFTTLDEYDGANYVRKALANESIDEDNANNRAELKSDTPVTWTSLGAGTRQCQAMILYRHVTNDADSVPLVYIDTGGFPFTGNGSNVVANMNAEGWVQIT